jgi:D-amino-acid dehydrogenase
VVNQVRAAQSDPVAIVGGGVIGVCCAYYLAKAGVPVVLFEADEICSGCSLGNLGLLAASHSAPLASPGVISKALKWMFDAESPFAIKWRADPRLLSWLWKFLRASRTGENSAEHAGLLELVLASMKLFEDFAQLEAGLSFGLERAGLMELFATPGGFEEAAEQVASLRAAGLQVDLLEAAEVQAMEPLADPDICGGLLYHDDNYLEPAEFVRGVAGLAAKACVGIHEHTAVTGFGRSGERIKTVETAKGSLGVSAVVLAAGSFSTKLAADLGITLPVQPARGYTFTARAIPGRIPRRAMMFSEVKALLIPMGDKLRLGGVMELGSLDRPVDRRRAEALVTNLNRYLLPQISFEGVEPWSGYRPCSPDGFPIIGWSKKWTNLLYATGHGMLGLTLGPVTGKIVTALLVEEHPGLNIARLAPSRFGLL